MSALWLRVARPTLWWRGLLGEAEPILIAGGRAVEHSTEVFVGIDVAKARNAVAVADGAFRIHHANTALFQRDIDSGIIVHGCSSHDA